MNRQEDRMPHSEQFLPEIVDEQIDQFSRLPESETVNGQLINDLHIASKEYIERRDRVWARIETQARERYSTEQMGIIPNGLPGSNFAGGQQNTQLRHFPFSLLHSRRKPLELIAAVLVAVLVVGSMLWLVAVTHPFSRGTTVVASGSTSSQVNSKPVISGQGTVYPNQEQDIQYSTSVQVKAVFVKAGDRVKSDQVLMRIVSGRIISQIQLAQAKLQAAQALLSQDTANGNTKHITEEQQQVALVQSELEQLLQQVNTMQGSNVTSSIAGVVTQVVDPEIVAANTPMLTVMNESTVVVHAKVPQTFMGQVHMNQVATVTTSALSVRSFKGTVTKIIPTVDPKTHTFEVWISVPNSTQQLVAGMYAEVQIPVK